MLDEYKDLNSRIETNKRALDSVTKERNLFIDSLKEKYNEEDTRILQNLLSKEEELKAEEWWKDFKSKDITPIVKFTTKPKCYEQN